MSGKEAKNLEKLSKNQLIELIRKRGRTESELNKKLNDISEEVNNLKEEMKLIHTNQPNDLNVSNINHRISELYAQEQYLRRECVELVGISESVPDNDLQKTVINIFKTAGVEVHNRDFQAIHRLRNKSTVIAKLANRRYSNLAE